MRYKTYYEKTPCKVVKFQSDETSLYKEILDMMEQIDLMFFCLIIDISFQYFLLLIKPRHGDIYGNFK